MNIENVFGSKFVIKETKRNYQLIVNKFNAIN